MTEMIEKKYELIVWGATSFTGKLVVEYLTQTYPHLNFALGGRNKKKLEQVAAQFKTQADLLVSDSQDSQSLEKMVRQTQVICSTVGPFAKYGSKLVEACAKNGTHYCDITGEIHWIRKMIESYGGLAKKSGARIVNCCGFDSIPSDIGVLFLQEAALKKHSGTCEEVRCRVKKMRGGFSGGTVASIINYLDEVKRDPSVKPSLSEPYYLNLDREGKMVSGPDHIDPLRPFQDLDKSWTAPFIMSPTNSRIVRRTHQLLGNPWGKNFRYSEALGTGKGIMGFLKAGTSSTALCGTIAALSFKPSRALLLKTILPRPGQGPSKKERESGLFRFALIGQGRDSKGKSFQMQVDVIGKRDPGYGATCRMLAESALLLVKNSQKVGGGFWTPASCLGLPLVDSLKSAGIQFKVQS